MINIISFDCCSRCHLNRYDGANHSMGMHADNEPDLQKGAPIGSCSFGYCVGGKKPSHSQKPKNFHFPGWLPAWLLLLLLEPSRPALSKDFPPAVLDQSTPSERLLRIKKESKSKCTI